MFLFNFVYPLFSQFIFPNSLFITLLISLETKYNFTLIFSILIPLPCTKTFSTKSSNPNTAIPSQTGNPMPKTSIKSASKSSTKSTSPKATKMSSSNSPKKSPCTKPKSLSSTKKIKSSRNSFPYPDLSKPNKSSDSNKSPPLTISFMEVCRPPKTDPTLPSSSSNHCKKYFYS